VIQHLDVLGLQLEQLGDSGFVQAFPGGGVPGFEIDDLHASILPRKLC
jgi:hypothetical protein